MSGKSGTSADRATDVDVQRESLTKAEVVPAMVKRYLAGERMGDLAAECGKSRRTIYRWFLSELGDEKYRETVTDCLVARVADADEELEAARMSGDQARVAAARETCRFVRMDLERRRPQLYGPKQEVKHTGRGPMLSIVLLDRPSGEEGGRVLEGTPVVERLPGPAVRAEEKQEA